MPRKRHTNKNVQATPEVELPLVTNVESILELPARYVMFSDDLEYAVKRLQQIEDKLYTRNIRVIWPLNVFRYNKMLAIEVEKI